MVKRRKGKQRKAPPYFPLWIFVLSVIAITIFFVVRRERRGPRRELRLAGRSSERGSKTAHAPRSETPEALSLRLRRGMEQAGGDDVWIRRDASSRPLDVDAIATQRAYPGVEQAALRTARAEDLRVTESGLPDHPARMRTARIIAWAGSDPVFTCTLREVQWIARAAIVVDDLGQSLNAAQELVRLHAPLTFSIMPNLPYSRATAEEAHRAGIEVMLHLPMQPLLDSAPDVSRQELKVGMGPRQIDGIIQNSLESVPFAAGVNNHMGSRATTDKTLMSEVMAELAARRLFYIDSRTISGSVALATARRSGVPAFYRSVFLDDTKSVPYTLGQLRRLCRIAAKQGVALAIGHPYPTTITALAQFFPQMEREGVQPVNVSKLLRQPEAASLAPLRPGRKLHGRT